MSYEAYVKHINSIIEEDLKEVEERIISDLNKRDQELLESTEDK